MKHQWLISVCTTAALLLLCISVSDAISNHPFIIQTSVKSTRYGSNISSCLGCINTLRGGYYENNPNCDGAPTLGNVSNDGFYHTPFPNNNNRRPSPLIQVINYYLISLKNYSPTLFNGVATSIAVFIMWQLPSQTITKILRNHFISSHYNIIRKKRYHALITSAFSHSSLSHLAVNMYAYIMFGRAIKPVLDRQGVALWVFVLSSAICSDITSLALGSSGLGLSGVTCAMLAFDALLNPTKQFRAVVSFIPITLPAYYLFVGLIGLSVAGVLGVSVGRANIGHAAHLGGLMYGAIFYNACKKGWVRLWSLRVRKVCRTLTGKG